MGHNNAFDTRVLGWINKIRVQARTGITAPRDFIDLNSLLHEQRLIKSAAELHIMRRAGEISAKAHRRVMRECKPGQYEYQLEAAINHEFANNGARSPRLQ